MSADDGRPVRGLWATLREAFRGSKADLTAIPIRRAVILLAVPMILETSGQALLSLVDIYFASRLGQEALSIVGLTEALLSLVYPLALGFGAGGAAMIARRIGEKDAEGAAAAAGQLLLLAGVVAAAVSVLGATQASRLLGLIGASEAVAERGSVYATVILGGSAGIFLLFAINAVLRAAGDAALAMRSLWVVNLVNVVLAPCLVYGLGPFPRWGIAGLAIAVTGARVIAVAYQALALWRGTNRIRLARRHFVPRVRILRELLRLGSVSMLQILVETASWLVLVRIVATFGTTAVAGYVLTMRIAVFMLQPSWGLAAAAATLVGQNLGARAPDRAARAVSTIARYNLIGLSLVAIAFAAAPGLFIAAFPGDAVVSLAAERNLRILAAGFVFFAYGMIALQSFIGAGDMTTPLIVNVGCFWAVKLPLAWVLAVFAGLGPQGIFIAILASYTLQAIVVGLLFHGGRWKSTTIAA